MSVTAQLTGFEACSEFSSPEFHNDTCGECAFLVLEHVRDGTSETGDAVSAVRDAMQAAGLRVAGGTTMGELVDFFATHRGLSVEYTNGYGSSWDAIHATLLNHAGRDGCVIEVELAYNLTGNEPGVHRHYVAIGGIHPTRGYLVANGDDVMALAAHGGHGHIIPCRWMDKNVIASARPSACAIVTGLPHSMSLSAAALAAPQARINEAGMIEDATGAATEAGDEEPAGASGSQEQAPSEVTPAAPSPLLPRYFDSDNLVTFRQQITQMQQALAQCVTCLGGMLGSLPEPFQS